jgi:hypothetical protein
MLQIVAPSSTLRKHKCTQAHDTGKNPKKSNAKEGDEGGEERNRGGEKESMRA